VKEYEIAWQGYRRRRNLFGIAFLSFVPFAYLIDHLTLKSYGWTIQLFAIIWMIVFLAAGIRMQHFPCPRCGKWFFSRGWTSNMIAERCIHCGLPKYSATD